MAAFKPHWLCASRFALSLIFTAYSGILPLVRSEWALSAAQAATIQSAWHVGYLVSLFGVGMLADHYGARRTFLVSSLFAAASALIFALFSHDYWSALLLHGFAGLCSGGSYTPGLALMYQHTEPARRGRAMGWFLASSSLGYAASLGVAALVNGAGAWRIGLLAAAAAAVAGAVFGWLALKGVAEAPRPQKPAGGQWRAIIETVRDKRAMACNWAYTFHCWELFGLWAWLPSFLAAAAARSDGATGAGWGIALAGLAHLIAVTGSVLGGTASDRLGRTRVMLLMSGASIACSFLFGWMWALPFWLLAAVAAVYNLSAIADSSVYSTALAETVPMSRLGAGYSVRSVLGFGAGAISPVVFGSMLDWGRAAYGADASLPWVLAWSSLGMGALIGPLMIRRFRNLSSPPQPAPQAPVAG